MRGHNDSEPERRAADTRPADPGVGLGPWPRGERLLADFMDHRA